MAKLTLDRIWVTLAADAPAGQPQSMAFRYVSSLSSTPQFTVSSQVYADGKPRMSWVDEYQTKLPVTLLCVTPADRNRLEFPASMGGWLGEPVWVRDDRGRKFSGYIESPQSINEHLYNGECDVQVTFTGAYVNDLL